MKLSSFSQSDVLEDLSLYCAELSTGLVRLTTGKHVELFVKLDSLEWIHIPIQDETAPTVAQIEQFVSLIDKAESEGTVRYLHVLPASEIITYMTQHRTLMSYECYNRISNLPLHNQ